MARARGPGAFASPSLAFFPPLLRGMRKRERRKRVRSPACFGPKHSSAAAAAAATGRETRVRAPCARLMALRALPWRRKPHRITSAPRRKAHLSWKNIIRTAREREREARALCRSRVRPANIRRCCYTCLGGVLRAENHVGVRTCVRAEGKGEAFFLPHRARTYSLNMPDCRSSQLCALRCV